MSQTRIRMVRQAFQKMDKDGSGTLTIEDLKG
jgi:Ca2+-binding EF-hand superfamily protein